MHNELLGYGGSTMQEQQRHVFPPTIAYLQQRKQTRSSRLTHAKKASNSVIQKYFYTMYIYQWCGFKSRRGKNKNLTALKSNSNTVWFNFQTYIYIYIYIYIYNLRHSFNLLKKDSNSIVFQ